MTTAVGILSWLLGFFFIRECAFITNARDDAMFFFQFNLSLHGPIIFSGMR
jgi:hypothetical protein